MRRIWRKGRARRRHPDNALYLAMHVAGHAVATAVLGLPLETVGVSRREVRNGRMSLGFTKAPATFEKDIASAMPHMIVAFAGPLAESFRNRHAHEDGVFDDEITRARTIATVALCGEAAEDGQVTISQEEETRMSDHINAMMDRAAQAAREVVIAHFAAIGMVSEELRKRKRLRGDEVVAIVEAVRMRLFAQGHDCDAWKRKLPDPEMN